jgi:tRNA (guanine10-N2)-methyltransferase
MPVYLLRIISHHLTFRIPELLSIAKLFEFEIKFLSEDLYRGILLVELEGDEQVQRILDRGVLVMYALSYYSCSNDQS